FSRLCAPGSAGSAGSSSSAANSVPSSPSPRGTIFARARSKMRSFAARYASKLPWRSRWSGSRLSRTATSHANSCTSSSWKLESSQTTLTPGAIASATVVRGRPTLPATSTSRPAARKIAPRSSVVVVLPFVPVTPTTGLPGSRRYPSSTSLHTGTPRARAAAASGDSAGTPGLFTTSSTPSSSASSSDPARTSTPASASLPVSTSAERSAATTWTPRRASASAAACPDRASPSTSTRPGSHPAASSGPVPLIRRHSPQGEHEGPCSDDICQACASPCRIRAGRRTSSGTARGDVRKRGSGERLGLDRDVLEAGVGKGGRDRLRLRLAVERNPGGEPAAGAEHARELRRGAVEAGGTERAGDADVRRRVGERNDLAVADEVHHTGDVRRVRAPEELFEHRNRRIDREHPAVADPLVRGERQRAV